MYSKRRIMNNIAHFAKCRGMCTGDLEEKTGISINHFLGEEPFPRVDYLMRMAYALGVSVDTLLLANAKKLTEEDIYWLDSIHKMVEKARKNKKTRATG